MNGDVMGGGVVVAIAAVLWLAYLVPVWLRRREYLATERNAVRLQQTLRILAETSELPDEVRVEATAKTVAEQQRILRKAEERRLATARAEAAAHARREQAIAEERRHAAEEAERAAAEAIALERASRAAAAQRARALAVASAHPVLSAQRRRRLRRSRALCTMLLVASLAGLAIGAALLLSAGAWLLSAVSGAVALAALGMLSRLSRSARATAAPVPFVPAAPASPDLYDHAKHDLPVQEALRQSWTPRPLPKPLHLSPGTVAAAAMASVDAAAELRRAAARADFERKATAATEAAPVAPAPVAPAPVAPAPVRLRPVAPSAPAAAGAPREVESAPAVAHPVAVEETVPNLYSAMGIVGSVDDGALDLDAVLRRRRAAS
ncbi:hypothetical protein ACPPVW_02015 [Leifsonia sp. McL0607]|uniref:hypothetical protein n=1 Tax=Leifsonia sp. McL0607 TaxID=3415672 RepID=UPI003CEA9B48